jgi:hypothetical protein
MASIAFPPAVPIVDNIPDIDQALDDALVGLGAIVLRMADPAVTATAAELRARSRSVNQYSGLRKPFARSWGPAPEGAA